MPVHIPVLLNESLSHLDPKSGENFIDCTVGMGGHARAIISRTAPGGRLLGMDLDGESLSALESSLSAEERKRITLVNANFADLGLVAEENDFPKADGILMDLGWSSWQLEESGRGFGFARDEVLDMRFGGAASEDPSASDIVNFWPEEKLETIIREYGEERFSRRIATQIAAYRKKEKIVTTKQLADLILKTVPGRGASRIHPATKTFQALRIAVNDELNNLKKGLEGAVDNLYANGRLVVISFHSLEDRIVKNFFRDRAKEQILSILTKKPVQPSLEEIKANPRARSAKLRSAVKIAA